MYFVAKLQGCANLAKRAPIYDEFISRHRALYTSDCRWLQKKKSKGLRSGYSGGQATGPPHPIHLLGYVEWGWLCTTIEKCTGASSRMNPTIWCVVAVLPFLFCPDEDVIAGFFNPNTALQISAFVLPFPLSWSSSSLRLLILQFSPSKRGLRPIPCSMLICRHLVACYHRSEFIG
ncbi:hypothetical protein TNCV_987971 [Trichonephila clavipes]|nr:hypothetical protein TNCV_987971 [Trichonephila clavipes]